MKGIHEMGDLKDKAKAKMNSMENKSHEMKGRVEQKKKDMDK
ncbi:MAG: hypothetical protein NVSMB46_02420 [Candidatus Saccharimonadales bacterium]